MKIKEVINLTGLPEKTIRFYESRGLIAPNTEYRNGRLYREFSEDDVLRLQDVKTLRSADFSIEEILRLQQGTEDIPALVETHRQRIAQRVEQDQTIQCALAEVDPSTISTAEDMAAYLRAHTACAERSSDTWVPELHFGLYDDESEEDKQRAISAYRSRKPHRYSLWAIVILAALNIVLISCLIAIGLSVSNQVPAATGSTEDYLYYVAGDTLMRCDLNGENPESIYTQTDMTHTLEFVVGEEKIFLLDGTYLYSINCDGTGKYRFDGTYAYSAATAYSQTWPTLAFSDGKLYACWERGGKLGTSTQKMAEITPETGDVQFISTSTTSALFGVWDGKLYIYDIHVSSRLRIIDLESGQTLLSAELDPEFSGCWFSEGEAFFADYADDRCELICITEDDTTGTTVDLCDGMYYGGYQNYCIYSDGTTAYVKDLSTTEEQKISIGRSMIGYPSAIISSDTDRMTMVAIPFSSD